MLIVLGFFKIYIRNKVRNNNHNDKIIKILSRQLAL